MSPAPATSEYVCVSPTSGSVVEKVPTTVPTGWSSATELLESAMSVGASLAQVTVTETVPMSPPGVSV